MKIRIYIKKIREHFYEHGLLRTIHKVLLTILRYNKIDLDDLIKDSPKSLDEIFIKFGTDKGSLDGKKSYYHYYRLKDNKFRNYLDWIKREDQYNYKYQLGLNSSPIYEKFFESKKNKKLKILEIGVANGHSIASWHHYFRNSMIYGIDIKPKSKFFYKSERIKYDQIDIFDKKKITKYIKKNGPFDYIIDDSMNTRHSMITNIINFFPSLRPGGIFFLEDVGFFTLTRKAFKDIENFNKEKGYEYFIDNRDMREMFEDIMNDNYLPDEHLNKNEINYLKNNIIKIESPNYNHPHAGMIIFHKKN